MRKRITRRKSQKKRLRKQKGGEKQTAYVINLDERTDRWNQIQNSFKGYNINLERVSAVRDQVGWKGCGYSHIKVIRAAKEKKLPFVLIMEDDCKPTEHFRNWFKIKEWLDKNTDKWDIFLGGNSYYGFSGKDNSVKAICKIDGIKLYNTKATSLQFYYVNSTAYDKILEWETYIKNNDTWIPIDLWPNKIGLRCVSSTPFIAFQEISHSNIENTVRDYTSYMKISEEFIASIPNNINC
jgi:GR25 family glycosyltransferase involved in LPS biosynthesis